MQASVTEISVVNYPGALQSAVHGFGEMFSLANGICVEQGIDHRFSIEIPSVDEILGAPSPSGGHARSAVILPPSIESQVYSEPDRKFLDWLVGTHSAGAVICSVCSGAFILAATGLLQGRAATTHWGLASRFSLMHPEIIVRTEKIVVNEGDLITAGGLMAWVDLGLELVAKFAGSGVMRLLGKMLVVDSGKREQRYYQCFSPRFDHGDADVLKGQHHLRANFHTPLSVAELSSFCCMNERTFLRRFVNATGLKPSQYLQRQRVQKACDLIESTDYSFEAISQMVGYLDLSSFRKTFIRITGLTPGDFKKRFAAGRDK